MIPNYRIRAYCLFGALVCLLGSWAIAEQILHALTTCQFDAITGRRGSKVKEHFVLSQQPWRFGWYLLWHVAVLIASSGAGLVLTWGVLRGRRAFKRWHVKF